MMKFSLRTGGWVVFGLTAVLAFLIFFDLWPFLRGDFGWRWPHEPATAHSWLVLLSGAGLLAVYGAGAWFLRQRATWLYLGWVVLGTAVITTHFLWLYGHPLDILYRRTVSTLVTGGYMTAAEQIHSFDDLRAWPQMMASGALGEHTHISISPPGWPALYWGLTQLLAQFPALSEAASLWLRPWLCDYGFVMGHTPAAITSAWLGILSPLWGALTAVPLYLLGRDLRDKQLGRVAAAGWVLVPALSLFMGTLNTPYPFMALLCLWLLLKGLQREGRASWGWLAGAGLSTAVVLTFNFALAPLMLWSGWLALLFWWLHPTTDTRAYWTRPFVLGGIYGAGLLMGMGLYWLTTGHHLLSLLPIAMDTHLTLDRPYWPWVWLHSWDVVLFGGLPIFLYFLYGAWRLPDKATRAFALALLLTLVTLVLSGTARGETGRVWLFFMPGILLVATAVAQSGPDKRRELALLGGAQILWLGMMVGVIRAVGIEIPPPVAYTAVVAPPLDTPATPVGARFGDELRLDSFQTAYQPESNTLTLALQWEPLQQMADWYFFSAVVVDANGTLLHAETWSPLNYQYPTTCWYHTPQTTIQDQAELTLPVSPTAPPLWISLSAFRVNVADNTPTYLPVTLPSGEVDPQQVGLGPIGVEE